MTAISRHVAIAFTLVISGSALVTPGNAQDSTQNVQPPSKTCFRGRPLPECDQFILTELRVEQLIVGGAFPVAQAAGVNSPAQTILVKPPGQRLSGEFGLMFNRGNRNAIGATLMVLLRRDGPLPGLKFRYRRWIGANGTAIDLDAGIVSSSDEYNGQTGQSLTAGAALNYKDIAAITAGVDTWQVAGHTKPLVYSGVRIGSKPGLIIGGIGTILLFGAYALSGGG